MSSTAPTPADTPAPKPKAKRAIGPKLRVLLYVLFVIVALLGANSIYLSSITFLEWLRGETYQNYFYQLMFLAHLVLGLVLILPFIVFGLVHMRNTMNRKNRRAVNVGYALFAVCLTVLITGLMLMRVGNFDLKHPLSRSVVYWLHFICPLLAGWMYWLHRLVGPKIKWRIGLAYVGVVGVVTIFMVVSHTQDPRLWNVAGPKEGEKYFKPSLAKTATGNFIPAKTMMMEDYCLKCHQDAHKQWADSAHHFSSFNNPAYLASIRETREVSLKRDGNVQASRWCAGCHDPVPFFSGAFDNPHYDLVKDPTSQAGITCTTCHSITHVNSTRGNADFTIEEPIHYPFAFSDNPVLQWVNNQLVKAKPSFHKKTFLKDFHKTAEFCSTCHKVSLPKELNHYKEFLRGQNHYDTYLLTGVSGHSARSFYYPPKSKDNCAECHMPLARSNDFGANLFGGQELSIHNHLFPAANTGLAWLKNLPEVEKIHTDFLKDSLRVDIFGLKEEGSINGKLHAPLRPEVPKLVPGKKYLLETVLRTLKLGHLFSQGTVDSNEIWVDVTVKSGDIVIGRSGGIDETSEVDKWSHFINVFMLDREGNRINRRNPQDIFVPLYNNQIPPGAAGVVHYELQLPDKLDAPVTIEVKLQYRKFDQEYMEFVTEKSEEGDAPIRGHERGKKYRNPLPIVTICQDKMTLPVEGVEVAVEQPKMEIPLWQRWNDYGIGLFLKGKAELRQAEEAFKEVEKLNRFDGPLNLARTYYTEGRLDEMVEVLKRASEAKDPPAPPWTLAWLTGLANREQGHLVEAQKNFRKVLEDRTPEMIEKGFDFSIDIEVINLLGVTQFDLAKQIRDPAREAEKKELLRQAVESFQKTLKVDSENIAAHYNLHLLYAQLGETKLAEEHQKLHSIYKLDENAADRAISLARQKYPWGNHAAEPLVIYSLNRSGAPGLQAAAGVGATEVLTASGEAR